MADPVANKEAPPNVGRYNGHTLGEIKALARQANCLTCGHGFEEHLGQGCAGCRCDKFNRLDPHVSPKTALALVAALTDAQVLRRAAALADEGLKEPDTGNRLRRLADQLEEGEK